MIFLQFNYIKLNNILYSIKKFLVTIKYNDLYWLTNLRKL